MSSTGVVVSGEDALNQSSVTSVGNITVSSTALPPNAATETSLAGLNAKVTTTANGIKIDGSSVTQPVSIASMPSTPVTGTFWQATQPISIASMPSTPVTAASLPLPTGASSETTLSALNTKVTTSALGIKTDTTPSSNGDLVDVLNSSTTPLTANAVFTGSWVSCLNYAQLSIMVYTDVDGLPDTALQIEFSQDGTNVHHTHEYGVDAVVGEQIQVHTHAKYHRIIYTNGSVGQTTMALQTIMRPYATLGSVIEVDDVVTSKDDCLLTKTILMGKQANAINQRYTNVNVSPSGSVAVTFDSSSLDAFGRLRVCEPFTLFESQHRYKDNGQWDTSLVGAGTNTYLPNESSIALSVTTASGDHVLRESKTVQHYQPGKSLLYLATFVMNSPLTNLTQRLGYYGAQNGAYFEVANATANVVLRSYATGSIVENRISQSTWNIDTLDGTGSASNPSGILFDSSKSQILFIDFEWLGVGRVHYGFVINGIFIPVHSIMNANTLNKVYMTTACLPCRYEIFTTGVISGAATMKQICTTVMSEGGYQPQTTPCAAGTGLASKTLTTALTNYPIVSIRLNSSRLDTIVLPSGLDILVDGTTVTNVMYQIVTNPTLTGASWVTHANGNVDYDISSTSLSGGSYGPTNYVGCGANRTVTSLGSFTEEDFSTQLGRTIAGVSDIITIVAVATAAATAISAQLHWEEVL